ncbi:MAG: hypothetical protein ABI618_05550 [Nitrospirota bacterium]
MSRVEEAFEEARVLGREIICLDVGDAVTAAVVSRYIRCHRHEGHEAKQLSLVKGFSKACPLSGELHFFKYALHCTGMFLETGASTFQIQS